MGRHQYLLIEHFPAGRLFAVEPLSIVSGLATLGSQHLIGGNLYRLQPENK